MTSISSTQSTSGLSQAWGTGQSRGRGGPKQLEKDLQNFLQTQGVSEEGQKEILDEIKSAIESSLAGNARPDPVAVKDIVQGVLEKHGINGTSLLQNLQAPSSGPRGKEKSEDQNSDLFLEFLTKEIDKQREKQKAEKSENRVATPQEPPPEIPFDGEGLFGNSGDPNRSSPYGSLAELVGSSSTFSVLA